MSPISLFRPTHKCRKKSTMTSALFLMNKRVMRTFFYKCRVTKCFLVNKNNYNDDICCLGMYYDIGIIMEQRNYPSY